MTHHSSPKSTFEIELTRARVHCFQEGLIFGFQNWSNTFTDHVVCSNQTNILTQSIFVSVFVQPSNATVAVFHFRLTTGTGKEFWSALIEKVFQSETKRALREIGKSSVKFAPWFPLLKESENVFFQDHFALVEFIGRSERKERFLCRTGVKAIVLNEKGRVKVPQVQGFEVFSLLKCESWDDRNIGVIREIDFGYRCWPRDVACQGWNRRADQVEFLQPN